MNHGLHTSIFECTRVQLRSVDFKQLQFKYDIVPSSANDSLCSEYLPCAAHMPEWYPYTSCRAHGGATCPLRSLLLLGLEGLLAVAPYHDDGEEGADDGGEQDNENHRDADGPDAGEEERVQDVVLVDEGLESVSVEAGACACQCVGPRAAKKDAP